VRLLAGYEPAPVPLQLASPKIRTFADYLAERRRSIDSLGAYR
jgi:hypothetical protein